MKRKLLYLGVLLLAFAVVAFGLFYAPLENFEIGRKEISDEFADSGDLKLFLESGQEYQVEIVALPALDDSNYQVYVENEATENVVFQRQGDWIENSTFRLEVSQSGSYQIKWNKLRVSQITANEITQVIPKTSLLAFAVLLLAAGLASIIIDFKSN